MSTGADDAVDAGADPPVRVLYADVDGDLAERLSAAGEGGAFDVVAVDTAERCLAVLERERVDCVVSEWTLPDADGLGLLRRVRERSDVPFVLYTGEGSEAVASEAIAAGVTDYVRKSEDAETVASRLGRSVAGGRSRADLREAATRYRRLLETSPAPVVGFDGEGRILFGNDALLSLVGVDAFAALEGRSVFEFVDPTDRERARRRLRRVVEAGEHVERTTMALRRVDGERRTVTVATAPCRYGGERIAQAALTDVTQLREAERELRAERRFVERALDAIEDVFYVVDADGEIVRWNGRALEVTGYTAAELAEMEFADLVVGEDLPRARASMERTLAEGRHSVELRLLTRDGRTVPFEFRGRRLVDDAGAVVGLVGIGRDVSERRARERELARRRDEFEAVDRTNEILRGVNAALVDAESREEIERAVCEQFAGDGPYRFAWVGAPDRSRDRVVPRAWAGVERGYLDTLEVTLDDRPTGRGPAARALRTGEVQTATVEDPSFAPWRDAAVERGYAAVAAVPIGYGQVTYGVLVVYAGETDGADLVPAGVLAELGATVGHAVNAVERKRALVADAVVELDLELSESTEFFCRFSAAVGAPVALEKVTPETDGRATVFLTVPADAADRAAAVADRFRSVEAHALLAERGDERVLELQVTEPLVVDRLATHGAVVRSLTAAEGRCELTVEAPADADVRALLETLRESHPGVELAAKRERTGRRRPALAPRLDALLTDRQQEVLETAYFAGYFEEPRELRGTDVAALLDISGPTFHHHLRSSLRRLLAELFGARRGDDESD